MPTNVPNNAETANRTLPSRHGRTPEGTNVAVECDGDRRVFDPADLLDEDCNGENPLAVACVNAAAPPRFVINTLLNLEDEHRWALLSLIRQCNGRCTVEDESEPVPLFDAVLRLMVGHADIVRCQRGLRAAIEAAVLYYPEALEPACSRIRERMRQLGVTGIRTEEILRDARQLAIALTASDQEDDERGQEEAPLKANFADAPVSDDVLIPPGWDISDAGISRESNGGEDNIVICSTPVVVTGRLTTEHTGTEALRLDSKRDGTWRSRIVDRKLLATTRTVVDLSEYGIAVNSNNASQVVQYLADFESVNLSHLPHARVTNHLGWQGTGDTCGFLWGRTFITSDASHDGVDLNVVPPHEWPTMAMAFRGDGEGDEQLADGFHQRGSDERWIRAIDSVHHFPRVMLAMYSALATPLLSILDSPNFVVDLCGPTSQGKTITLRLAASCWGCPDEKSPSAAITTWDSTRVFIEGACAVQTDLPLVVDDTKRAKNQDQVAQIIYDVASGRGRGRGSPQGLRRSGTFRTVLLMNGEAPATSFTQDGGTRARVLTLWGSPFGGTSSETATMVNALDRSLRRHYGHAGPRLVSYLVQNRSRWSVWRKEYRNIQRAYEERAGDNSVANRMSAHFAVITMAARLAHEAMELPWDYADPVEPLWDELVREAEESDRSEAALR